jgi:hypothetical protein
MAVPRFYRVLRGQRTPAARQKFLDYLAGLSAGEDRTGGTSKNRPNTVPLFVHPFSLKYDATLFVKTSCLQPAYDAMGSAVASNLSTVTEATGSGKTQLRLSRFKAARISRTVQTSGAGTYAKSKLTGLTYTKYNKSSLSIPFGAGSATDEELTIFAELAAVVKGTNSNYTVRHIKEDL